jgi:hypothetical protein
VAALLKQWLLFNEARASSVPRATAYTWLCRFDAGVGLEIQAANPGFAI